MGRDLSPHIAGGYSRSVPTEFGKERPKFASASPASYHLQYHFESSRQMPWATDGLAEPSGGFLKISTPGGMGPPGARGDYAWTDMHGFRCR